LQKRKTSNLDQRGTSERGKAPATAKHGRGSYSKKSSKASSRKKGRGASAGRKQRGGQRQTVYNIAELLPAETIRKLKEMKR